MKSLILILASMFVSLPVASEVQRSQLTSGMEAREPVDMLSDTVTLTNDALTTLYFFTQIGNMAGKEVVHRWFYNGKEMAAVTLNIRSNRWRTYSSKKIMGHWTGDWQVQVWHNDLQLMQHEFTVVNPD